MKKALLPTRKMLMASVCASMLMVSGCDDTPDNPFDAAVQASEAGDFQTARIMIRQALDQDGNNPAAIMLYGKTQLSLENPEGAAVEFQKLLGNPEFGAEANALLAKSYLQGGNTKLAFETLATGGMNSGLAYAVSVVAQLSEGDADKAIATLDEGLAQFPQSVDLLVLDAKRAYDQRQIDRSRSLLERIFEERPNMIEARLLAGRLELNEKQLDAAKAHFDKVLASNPWNLPAILSQAAIAREQGDDAKASEWLARSKEISPGHPVGAYFAAQMAFEAGDIDQAHQLVQSLGGKNGEFPALRMLRGLIAAERGQSHSAISELERFFRLGGEHTTARTVLAQQYAATGADQRAWDTLQPALGAANASPVALQLGANLAAKLGKPEQASIAARARKASTTVPYAAKLAEATKAMRAGKWQEADAIYKDALRNGGDSDPIVLNNAANIRLELGDNAGAVALARKAFQLAPADPVIMDTLGWSLIKADPQSAEGRSLIGRAVQLAPSNSEIANHWIAINR